jgi:hypothetical protein
MLLAFVLATMTLGGPGFSRVAQEKGVTVYKRDSGRGITVAAVGDIAAPPERVRAVLLDYAGAPRWNKHVAESRVLSRGDDSLLVYQRLKLPMLDDRDFTLHVTWGQSGEQLWLQFVTDNERGPAERSGVVRMPTHEGAWRLSPTDDGRSTHAEYFVHLDLAGSLPGWMARSRAGKEVPGMFEELRKQAAAR